MPCIPHPASAGHEAWQHICHQRHADNGPSRLRLRPRPTIRPKRMLPETRV